MAADTRTVALAVAAAFLEDPWKSEESLEPLAVLGMFHMLFPLVKVDWIAAGMIVDAVKKVRETDDADRKPVGWMHEMKEPGREDDPLVMFSLSPENPWSHWTEEYRAQCVYTLTPLVKS